LSNEEKTNDYENFEKGMIYMKILKKRGGGSREKGGGGNEIHAPCPCASYCKAEIVISSKRNLFEPDIGFISYRITHISV
jgi:hypothetical protein